MSIIQKQIAVLRRDYSALELDEKSVMSNPFRQFEFWMEQALEAELQDANAMTLATSGAGSQPDLRIVLLRGVDKNGFTFFTNYKSRKGTELSANKKACLNFFWPELQRQVRIAGTVRKVSAKDSDAYFATRPRESQIGAWASHQSETLRDRRELMDVFEQYVAKFRNKTVPRPAYWGGYVLVPSSIEFWQGRPNRLHDRIFFERKKDGRWKKSRLSP
jgi:pyridoxamine 5'-phosphate oxidase